jgi:hypothetical protein
VDPRAGLDRWTPGPVWTGAENFAPHQDSIPEPSSPQRVAIPTALCVDEVGLQKRTEEGAHLSASRVLAVFLQAHSRTVFGLTTTASLFSTDSNYPFATAERKNE